MKEFKYFLRKLITVELVLFFLSCVIAGLAGKAFMLSLLIGWTVMAVDYFLLIRFSKRVPQLVAVNVFPKSGFMWRFLTIAGILLVSISLFTHIDFFAIILAVITANLGLFIAVILHSREQKRWKDTLLSS